MAGKTKRITPVAIAFFCIYAASMAWGFFAKYMHDYQGWALQDIANWSQIISTFELIAAFAFSAFSDQRILDDIERDREKDDILKGETSAGIMMAFKVEVVDRLPTLWYDEGQAGKFENYIYDLPAAAFDVPSYLPAGFSVFYENYTHLLPAAQLFIAAINTTLSNIKTYRSYCFELDVVKSGADANNINTPTLFANTKFAELIGTPDAKAQIKASELKDYYHAKLLKLVAKFYAMNNEAMKETRDFINQYSASLFIVPLSEPEAVP